MKNGGRIPWNVIAIFEIFKNYCLVGKYHMNCDQKFLLEQWSNITQLQLQISNESINSDRKSCHARRIWHGDIMVADNEEVEEMDASELHAKRLNA